MSRSATAQSLTISDSEFHAFAAHLQECSGIVLSESKKYLVVSRLSRLMRVMKVDTMADLVRQMKNSPKGHLSEMVIEAMTTNETSWFRDNYPFEYFKNQFIPEMQKQGNRNIHVWCAASSTGQEPYSLSMCMSEAQEERADTAGMRCAFLATDISSSILAEARTGIYNEISMARGLSPERRKKFFTDAGSGLSLLNAKEKDRVSYEIFNLMHTPSHSERFDLILCRNVLIYFSLADKQKILQNFHKALKKDAYLMLGSTELAVESQNLYERVRIPGGTIYRKK